MPIFKQISGTRYQVRRVRRYINGVWQEILLVQALAGAAQVSVHKTLLLTLSGYSKDIFVEAGSPTSPVTVLVTVTSGSIIASTYGSGDPALDTGTGWHANSRIILLNNGSILGAAGFGGAGAGTNTTASCVNAVAGTAGGDAINLQHPMEIINAGIIGGGGGGGGGGSSAVSTGAAYGGGGGGSGAGFASGDAGAAGVAQVSGYFNVSGSIGSLGDTSNGGGGGGGGSAQAGAGGAGGGLGEAGSSGLTGSGGGICTGSAASGGAAGKAVEPNGNTLNLSNIGTGVVYGATS